MNVPVADARREPDPATGKARAAVVCEDVRKCFATAGGVLWALR